MNKDMDFQIDADLIIDFDLIDESDLGASPHTLHDLYMFEALFRSHKSKLTAFIRKHIRSSAAVDDIVQQAFLEAYRCWHKFRGDSKPETWLYGIALNIVRNNVSRAPEYRFTFEDTDEIAEHSLGDTAEDPLVSALRCEMMGRLRAAIKVLPESMSLVVQMVVLDGYSYKEAAKELRIPVGTVRSRLSRARESLKTAVIG